MLPPDARAVHPERPLQNRDTAWVCYENPEWSHARPLRKIRKLVLKQTEGLCAVKSLLGRFHHIVAVGPFDEIKSPPVVPLRIAVKALTVMCRNQIERIPESRIFFTAQMLCNPRDVFHHQLRLFEDVMIDPLEQVRHLRSVITGHLHAIGVVDMPAAEWLGACKAAIHIEGLNYFAKLIFRHDVPAHIPASG